MRSIFSKCPNLHVPFQIGDADCEISNPAMTKSQIENSHVEQPYRVPHRVIEAPVTYELVQRHNESHVRESPQVNDKSTPQPVGPPPLPCPRVGNLIARSEHSQHSSHPITQGHVEEVTGAPYVTKITVADSGNSRASHASYPDKTARQSDVIPITEARSAKDVPLPYSRVTSLVIERKEDRKVGKSSVSPKESVSQVSTRRSGRSGRSKHHSSHHSGSGKDHEDGDHRSRTSRK